MPSGAITRITSDNQMGTPAVVEDEDRSEEPTPVPPPPATTSPSATGVVAGDPDELREAPPSENDGED